MQDNLAFALAAVGLSEGGYVNNPKDPGGPTDRGITQATYDAYNKRHGLPARPVRGISKELAEKIIADNYFAPIRFADLPAGLDYSVGDMAVNSGPKRAVMELQEVLGFKGGEVDGIVGDKTLAAVAARNDLEGLIIAYNDNRMTYLRSLSTFKTFGKGWTARVMGKIAGAQVDDIGVIDRSIKLARAAQSSWSPTAKSEAIAAIPLPTVAAPGKARDTDKAVSTLVNNVASDPIAAIPAVGTLITPLVQTSGPIAWALAAVIIIAGVVVLVRALKRQA